MLQKNSYIRNDDFYDYSSDIKNLMNKIPEEIKPDVEKCFELHVHFNDIYNVLLENKFI